MPSYRSGDFSSECISVWHELGRPADAHQKAVWPAYSDLVQAPFAVTQDASRTDYQVLYSRGDGCNVRRANENAKRIVFRNAPWAGSCLGQVYLAAPSSQDNVVGATGRAGKAETLPKRNCGGQVVAWDYGSTPAFGAIMISKIAGQLTIPCKRPYR